MKKKSAKIEKGRALYHRVGCVACHAALERPLDGAVCGAFSHRVSPKPSRLWTV